METEPGAAHRDAVVLDAKRDLGIGHVFRAARHTPHRPEQPIGVRTKLKCHLTDILAHETLRLLLGRAEIPAPTADAKLAHRLAVLPFGLQLRFFERELIHAVVAEGREAEQHADALALRVGDELPAEVGADVGVVGVVLPGDREFLGAESARHPEEQEVAAVGLDAVDRLLPLRQAERRHAHEGDVVAAVGEERFVRGERGAGCGGREGASGQRGGGRARGSEELPAGECHSHITTGTAAPGQAQAPPAPIFNGGSNARPPPEYYG